MTIIKIVRLFFGVIVSLKLLQVFVVAHVIKQGNEVRSDADMLIAQLEFLTI